MRKHGLLVRFRANASATWTITATLRQARQAARDAGCAPLTDGSRSKTFKAHTGSGTVRLRIPAARLAGMRTLS